MRGGGESPGPGGCLHHVNVPGGPLKSIGWVSLANSEMPLPDHEARLEISWHTSCHRFILQEIHLVNFEPYHCDTCDILPRTENGREAVAATVRTRMRTHGCSRPWRMRTCARTCMVSVK